MTAKKIIPLLALMIFINNLPAFADIIVVPRDYPTIQEGIDAANEGDTVLVKPGEYVENIDFIGKNIVVASLFLTSGNPEFIATTIIDGGSSGSVVTFESGEDSTAVIMGFTIQNGREDTGSGIYCENSGPEICYNMISDNIGAFEGGGIYCYSSNPVITFNTIMHNIACFGGGIYGEGIYRDSSRAIIENNLIVENEAPL